MTEDFKLESEIINIFEEKDISKINIIMDNILYFTQTASIMSEFKHKFEPFFDDAGNIKYSLQDMEVIETIISSMEDSSISSLGRVFDDDNDTNKIDDFVKGRFIENLKNGYGCFFCLLFLRAVGENCENLNEGEVVEKYAAYLYNKIKPAKEFYKKSRLKLVRNNLVAHSKSGKEKHFLKTLKEIKPDDYIEMAKLLLQICFEIKNMMSGREQNAQNQIEAKCDEIIFMHKASAESFINKINI
ncbi:AbiU2 domain-containing protein [Novacetimonas hansenii]|uniref:AbiU2 domain-containing protein n=1 Tax=Novacetimonas hansenii TaxID=436 RepID=UPI0007936A62|nr:hypothetical protein [Novacetimonas hansenii]WEQ58268.1 hypothetical protein LV563_10390 [Novacetimonas hansenii]CUW48590.1 hypothetical protein ATCC53582_02729 [Novacetimonas hansenii]